MARTVYGGSTKQKSSVFGGRYSAQSNSAPSGVPQGSPGGVTRGVRVSGAGRRPGMKFRIGDEGYVWILIIIEAILTGVFRRQFRRFHGG